MNATVERLLGGLGGIHAVLFYGSEGSGMLHFAQKLAQGWLCRETIGGQACGTCAVCKSFTSGRNVDFMHYRPWGPTYWLKEQALRRVKPHDDEGPDTPLLEFLRTSPLMARHKVAVFEDADRLYGGAANGLLKTLEEPPDHAKIILTTHEFTKISPTIRSRCMSVACGYEESNRQDDYESVFGSSPELRARIAAKPDVYAALWDILQSSLGAPQGAALKLSEQTRGLTESLAKSRGVVSRSANAEILRCMSEWLMRYRTDAPHLAQEAVDAHRLILGNVNSGALFDQLWSRVLAQ